MVNVVKTKTVTVRDRDVQRHNETHEDFQITVDSREISFVVPVDMSIEEREIELLLATYSGAISVNEMKEKI